MKNLLHNQKIARKAFIVNALVKLSMIFMLVFILSAQSFAIGSELKLTTWNKGSFILELDHERFHVKDQFNIGDLRTGKHRLRVLQEQRNIHTGQKRMKVLYNGFIGIEKETRIVAVIKPNNRLQIVKKTRIKRDRRGCHYTEEEHQASIQECHSNQAPDECYEYVDYSEYNSNYPMEDNSMHCDCQGNCTCGNTCNCQGTCSCQEQNVYELDAYMVDYEEDIHEHCHNESDEFIYDEYDLIMNTNSFNNLIEVLEDEWFDSKKILIAKGALDNNTFSASQMLELIETLGFESARLDVAKYGYDSVIDKENYYIVFKAFNFESSIRELQLFMNDAEN